MSFGQELSAKVVDENKEPLIGATVYFDGTTVGVITNFEGVFAIEMPDNLTTPNLVITSLGYESIYITDLQNIQTVYQLKPKAVKLDAVNVYDSTFERPEMMEAFKAYFLGTGKEARQCKILNSEDIILYFLRDENTLYAEASNPIIIQNDYLGYKVVFDLKSFKVQYTATTLEDKYLKESFYAGYSFFKDTNPTRKRLRQKTYFSSLNFFLKSLVEHKLDLTNFGVGYNGDLMSPKKVFNIKPLEEELFEVSLKDPKLDLETGEFLPTNIIVTHNYDLSNILFLSPAIRVDRYGNNLDYDKIRLLGELSKFKIAKMLPTNYLPEK